MGKSASHEPTTCGSQHDPISAAIRLAIPALQEFSLLEAIEQPGDIGPMNEQCTAQLRLRAAIWGVVENLEDIELAWAKPPLGEENPARIPERFGGAQETNECLVTGIEFSFYNWHGTERARDCL